MPSQTRTRPRWTALMNGNGAQAALAALLLGGLCGHWTVASMRLEQAPAPSWIDPEAAPRLINATPAGYDMLGTADPQDAGYRWAEMASAMNVAQCPDASPAFRQGCARYVGERRGAGAVVVHVGTGAIRVVQPATAFDNGGSASAT